MKKLQYLLLIVFMIVSLVGCNYNSSIEANTFDGKNTKVAVVIDSNNINDGGFNQDTYEGAKTFAEVNNYKYECYQQEKETVTDKDRVKLMRKAVSDGAGIIVVPGLTQVNAITEVAAESPDVKFIFVDGWNIGMNNVTAICYSEEEAGYLAGYAAVKDGYTKLGGTFGGLGTYEACNKYCYGYIQGINKAAQELDIVVDVVISFLYGESFDESKDLENQITKWYENGTEVVFSCGGAMINSVINAANNNQEAKIIGVDIDQTYLSDRIITSACKSLKNPVEKTLEIWKENNWNLELADKSIKYGVVNNGVYLPTNEESWKFNSFTINEYNDILNNIANGETIIDSDCPDLTRFSNNLFWKNVIDTSKNIKLVVEE